MWKSNEIEPFAGKYSASVWHNNAGEVSILTSPVFAIPETGDIVASFAWGGALCNRLEKGMKMRRSPKGLFPKLMMPMELSISRFVLSMQPIGLLWLILRTARNGVINMFHSPIMLVRV